MLFAFFDYRVYKGYSSFSDMDSKCNHTPSRTNIGALPELPSRK